MKFANRIGFSLIAWGVVAGVFGAQSKLVIPSGWGEHATKSPAISVYLPSGWRWADLTLNGSSIPGAMTLILQARGASMPGARRVTDSLLVSGTAPTADPVNDETLKTFAASLQKMMPNASLIASSVVDLPAGKGFMVHMKLPMQGETDKPRFAEQYTYAIPGKKYLFHVVYTFVSGVSGFDDIQKKSIGTFVISES